MAANTTPKRQLQLGVFFQGVNVGTVWKSPTAGSQIAFESFRRMIQTAERGGFVHFFLAEGLRLRENRGEIYDLDVVGRPDAQSLLAAAAAETEHIGLIATQNATYNDPVDLARRLQSLDLVSEGRAGWNVVTTDDAWTGENFKRGGYLDHADRYTNAADVLSIARQTWRGERVDASTKHYSVTHTSGLPRSPQGEPIIFQAGVSPEGRDFAARNAEVIFSPFSRLDQAHEYREDLNERVRKAGRRPEDVKVMPGAEFVLAETAAEVEEKEHELRRQQVGPEQAISYLETYWGTDLSDLDPDGPLPDFDPVIETTDGTRGKLFQGANAKELADDLRAEAKEKGWSVRDAATAKLTGKNREFVGTFDAVADRLVDYAESGAVDGFNITPYIVPHGIDDIVNELVPRLKDRGIYPEGYAGDTLRENLGLPEPPA